MSTETMTRGVVCELRDGLEDVQFVAGALRLWADDVRQARASEPLVEHWWARVVELPTIATRLLARLEQLSKRRKRRRRGSVWRTRVMQLELPLAWTEPDPPRIRPAEPGLPPGSLERPGGSRQHR